MKSALVDINPVKTLQANVRSGAACKISGVASSGKEDISDVLKKSIVMNPGFERFSAVPPYRESLRAARKRRRGEREQTAGPKWFGLEKGSLEDNFDDLEIIRMRSGLGSLLGKQRYYRASDRRNLPKYFQKGTVVETAADFYSGRVPKKQRKKTLVEELLADVEIRKGQQSKYDVIAAREAKKRRAAANRTMKRLKKNKRH